MENLNNKNYKFRNIKGNFSISHKRNFDWDLLSPFMLSYLKNKVVSRIANYICSKIVPVISSEAFLVIIILRVELGYMFWPTIKVLSIGICLNCLNTLYVLFFMTRNLNFTSCRCVWFRRWFNKYLITYRKYLLKYYL